LLTPRSENAKAFLAAVQEVLTRQAFYQQLILESVRPKIEEWMGPENWWRRFFEITDPLISHRMQKLHEGREPRWVVPDWNNFDAVFRKHLQQQESVAPPCFFCR